MERCPNCRARSDGADRCRRCGMEHHLLRAVEQAADDWLYRGVLALARQDRAMAEQALRRSLSLKQDPLAEQLLALLDWGRPGRYADRIIP